MSDLPPKLFSVDVWSSERGPELFRYTTDGETPKSGEVYIIGDDGHRRRIPKRRIGVTYFPSVEEAVQSFIDQREEYLRESLLKVEARRAELRLVRERAVNW